MRGGYQANGEGSDEEDEYDEVEETALESYETPLDKEECPVDEYAIFQHLIQSEFFCCPPSNTLTSSLLEQTPPLVILRLNISRTKPTARLCWNKHRHFSFFKKPTKNNHCNN